MWSWKLLPAGLYRLTKHASVQYIPRYLIYAVAIAHCHGLFVLCGDTRIQLPRKGLYRRCDISSRIASGIVVRLSIGIGNKFCSLAVEELYQLQYLPTVSVYTYIS